LLEKEVAVARAHLEQLKEKIGVSNELLNQITDEHLRQSRILRTQVQEYKELFFFRSERVKGSF
jgi:hypothetical protein